MFVLLDRVTITMGALTLHRKMDKGQSLDMSSLSQQRTDRGQDPHTTETRLWPNNITRPTSERTDAEKHINVLCGSCAWPGPVKKNVRKGREERMGEIGRTKKGSETKGREARKNGEGVVHVMCDVMCCVSRHVMTCHVISRSRQDPRPSNVRNFRN